MGTLINETVTLETVNCGECGGTYAINQRYKQQRAENGGGWHCPYCECSWGYYGDTELKRAQKALEIEKARLVSERARHDQTKAELREMDNRRKGEKAAKTRIKNRVANGVCPCCKRSFVNLHRHMTSQHPDFAKEPQ